MGGDSGGEKRGDSNPEKKKKTERRSRDILEKILSNFIITVRGDLKYLTSLQFIRGKQKHCLKYT